MKKYIAQLSVICVLLSIVGCGRKWNNPVESAVPLPGVPGLISPANNAWIWNAQDTITFTWSKVDGATKYKLRLSNYSTISDSFVAIEIADTFYNWVDTNKLGKIYWQVKAWNPINEWKPSLINVFEKGPYVIGKTFTTYYGGEPNCQIIYNNYTYFFYNTEIAIYDISNYNTPLHIKNVIYPRGNSTGLKAILANNLLYILVAGDGLSIASLTDPLNPTEIGYVTNCTQIDVPRNIGIAVRDTIAYVANFYNGLFLINIKDPNNPTNVSSCNIGKYSYDVTISGNYAYIAKQDSGITVVDISDPVMPVVVNNISCPRTIFHTFANSNILYASYYKFSLANPIYPEIMLEDIAFWFHKLRMGGGILFGGMYVYQENNITKIAECVKINGDTLASFPDFDINSNYQYSYARYYKQVSGGRQDIGSGVCVFKVAPFSVTK
ncbi:TPA: hypothetical protein DCG35_10150 [Candidatus Edwardsbacteria bacterium]|nr:hypothetical protein [Candidatus Edwardsbacteria bacterium]HBZ86106.1 hypothetical protein [Candidatus Edwardsbacteria bacterium]